MTACKSTVDVMLMFEGLRGSRRVRLSAAVQPPTHLPAPSVQKNITGFLRFAWTPLGSSGGLPPPAGQLRPGRDVISTPLYAPVQYFRKFVTVIDSLIIIVQLNCVQQMAPQRRGHASASAIDRVNDCE